MSPLERKNRHNHRNHLMNTKISNEDDIKNIFGTSDKNSNNNELKNNIL